MSTKTRKRSKPLFSQQDKRRIKITIIVIVIYVFFVVVAYTSALVYLPEPILLFGVIPFDIPYSIALISELIILTIIVPIVIVVLMRSR